MQFEFNGEMIDVPDEMGVLMVSNADLAEGVKSFARDYERALNENPSHYGDRITSHRLIVRIMREAARRLQVQDDITALDDAILNETLDFLDHQESKRNIDPDRPNRAFNQGGTPE